MKKYVYWGLQWFLAISIIAGGWYGSTVIYNKGIDEGIKRYHSQCFNIGGFIISKIDRSTVQCRGLGIIPKEEMDRINETPTT